MSDLAVFFGQALTVGVVIVLMVMALSVFFNRLPRLGPKRKGLVLKSATELFEEGRQYDVLLSAGADRTLGGGSAGRARPPAPDLHRADGREGGAGLRTALA